MGKIQPFHIQFRPMYVQNLRLHLINTHKFNLKILLNIYG